MRHDTAPPVTVHEIVIMGGGCYGTFYARQLERARVRGALTVERILVVDRDPACQLTRDLPPAPGRELVVQGWDAFLDGYLSRLPASPPPSYIVPTPLMPHLMFDWILRTARRMWPDRAIAQAPLTEPVGTPYDTLAPDGTRYVSWADWLCPTHCIEPATCPVIRAPRTWEMSETAAAVVRQLSKSREVVGPALFVTRHITDGVGAFTVGEAGAAERLLRQAGSTGRPSSLLVGTVSACHGALGLLTVG